MYDENEDENSDASKSSSNSSKNSEHVSSSNIRRENHHDDDQNDRNQGKQNGNNDQARMMKLEFLKQSDGSCIVACSPDENLEAYGKLQNANCNRVHVPLSCNEMKIMNWKNVPGLEMYPGVKLYRTSHMENCVIQRLKIEPRTVKPMETLDRHNAVIRQNTKLPWQLLRSELYFCILIPKGHHCPEGLSRCQGFVLYFDEERKTGFEGS